ncbi:Roundabout 2 [Liparis tanakae]|uniref:Roundabout 2 n=1 Tax=Liparis tanakae TaxID=230148 RepID=A0A4Z2H2P3_9TELE|nr:Roundabout 2 [Liparis tanakae]
MSVLRDDFRQAPSDVVVAAGEPAVMECVPPRGHPEPTVSWKRNNARVSTKDDRISIRGGKLMISQTRKSDAGMYVCVGTNMVGERDSDPAELVVYERPVLVRRPVNQVVMEEDTVDFLCEVHGDPAPTVRWRREEGELPRGRFEIRNGNSLHLFLPPQIATKPRDQIATQGRSISFQCGTTGNPPPAIFWQKEGSQMLLFPGQPPLQSGRYSVSMSGELTITDVHPEDSGFYICQAISVAGSVLTKALLEVEGEDGVSSVSRASEFIQLPGPPQKPLVTEVTKNTVTLTWQSNPHEGGAAVTSYIIEAFSQSVGSTWQTVADQVKQERHTVVELFPNTVYLFIVRAVNSYGLSDPSPISEPVRTQDGSPTEPAVDHRQVQRELGEVSVYLQKPVVLSPTSARISWTVALQSRYVQGYRVFYRTIGSSWLFRDVEATSDHSIILVDLYSSTEYEVKIRPYFNELQGHDGLMVLLRMPEEVLSAPPQAVSVVQLTNSSSISVSWEPPPHNTQSGIIREYKIWCLGSGTEPEKQINRTVDGAVLSILLTGLLPDVRYSVVVAAVTGLGVGAPSPPVSLLLTFPLGKTPGKKGGNLSISEQITSVVWQPAFIAGLGVAAWLVLMGFGSWLYRRHRRRKQLGHYTTSFAYTPAAVGIMNYPNQTEKRSTASNDSPIYSTINTAAEDDLLAYYDTYSSTSYNQGPDPYSSNPVLANAGLVGLELDLDQWTIQSGQSGSEYAKLQYTKKSNDKLVKQRSTGSSSRSAPLTWVDVLSLPLPAIKDQGHTETDKEEEQHRTYLMDASREELSSLPSKLPYAATLTSTPQRDAHKPGDGPRLQHFDQSARHQSSSQVSQSNPDLFTNTTVQLAGAIYHTSHWAEDLKGESLGKDENVIPYGQPSFLPQVQMSGYGSLGGGVLSRPSTAGRRRDENLT